MLPPSSIPIFLAKNLGNLPPVSVTNFDMSALIKDMVTVKQQLKLLQDAQEISICDHASLCISKQNNHTPKVKKTKKPLPPVESSTEDSTDESIISETTTTIMSVGQLIKSPNRKSVTRLMILIFYDWQRRKG